MDIRYKINALICADETTDLDAIQCIPAMQRRRLSKLAKLALHTAKKVLQDDKVDYIVWTSCYGDEQTTWQVMKDIAEEQTPSPTLFSVSVHNAISGSYSILYNDNTPATSLSSSINNSWQDAIVEAYGYLQVHQKKKALIIYYDAPLPEHYQVKAPTIVQPHAVAMIMSLDTTQQEQDNIVIQSRNTENTEIADVSSNLMSDKLSQTPAQKFYDFIYSEAKKHQSQSWVCEKC